MPEGVGVIGVGAMGMAAVRALLDNGYSIGHAFFNSTEGGRNGRHFAEDCGEVVRG